MALGRVASRRCVCGKTHEFAALGPHVKHATKNLKASQGYMEGGHCDNDPYCIVKQVQTHETHFATPWGLPKEQIRDSFTFIVEFDVVVLDGVYGLNIPVHSSTF